MYSYYMQRTELGGRPMSMVYLEASYSCDVWCISIV